MNYEIFDDYSYDLDEKNIRQCCFLRCLMMMYDASDDNDDECCLWIHIFGWN